MEIEKSHVVNTLDSLIATFRTREGLKPRQNLFLLQTALVRCFDDDDVSLKIAEIMDWMRDQ